MNLCFPDACCVRDSLRPLYDISSRSVFCTGPDELLFQTHNPEGSLATECEIPSCCYEDEAKEVVWGKFNLTKVYKLLKAATQRGDGLRLRTNGDNLPWVLLRPSTIGSPTPDDDDKSKSKSKTKTKRRRKVIPPKKKKNKKNKKGNVRKEEGKEEKEGQEEEAQDENNNNGEVLLCKGKLGTRVRLVNLPRSKHLDLKHKTAVLAIPSAELQSVCGELAVVGSTLQIRVADNKVKLGTVGLTGKIFYTFHTMVSIPANWANKVVIQHFSLQLLQFCMQILSQCKHCVLYIVEDRPLLMEAETSHGVRYYVHVLGQETTLGSFPNKIKRMHVPPKPASPITIAPAPDKMKQL